MDGEKSKPEKSKEEELLEALEIIGMPESKRRIVDEQRAKSGLPSIDEVLARDVRDYVDPYYKGETR